MRHHQPHNPDSDSPPDAPKKAHSRSASSRDPDSYNMAVERRRHVRHVDQDESNKTPLHPP